MPDSQSKTLAATHEITTAVIKRARPQVGLFQCLIVSANAFRREMLVRSASEGGWEAVVCSTTAQALECLSRMFLQLAVVDLDHQDPADFTYLLEKLAPSSSLLLIVCGNEGDVQEEVWVRQLGAWLYLPGVVDASNLTLLCNEARHLAQRLNPVEKTNGVHAH